MQDMCACYDSYESPHLDNMVYLAYDRLESSLARSLLQLLWNTPVHLKSTAQLSEERKNVYYKPNPKSQA